MSESDIDDGPPTDVPPPMPDFKIKPPPPAYTIVPDVEGLNIEVAKKAIKKAFLTSLVSNRYSETVKQGDVIRQGRAAKSKAKSGTSVPLDVSDPKQTNISSRVPKTQMDAFVKELVDLDADEKKRLGFPLFSVSDCNSFHTTGYLWAFYAAKMVSARKLPSKKPIAVINFDRHDDAGGWRSPLIKSDEWGNVLVESLNEIGYPACYVSLFNGDAKVPMSCVSARGGKGKQIPTKELVDLRSGLRQFTTKGETVKHIAKQYQMSESDLRAVNGFGAEEEPEKGTKVLVQPVEPPGKKYENVFAQINALKAFRELRDSAGPLATEAQQYKVLWRKLNAYFGQDVAYVFVTVDRDCLNDSYTQWGDGRVANTEALTSAMKLVLGALADTCKSKPLFIGLDVTGLPEHKTLLPDLSKPEALLTESPGKEFKSYDEVWQGVDAQLNYLYKWFSSEGRKLASPIRRGEKTNVVVDMFGAKVVFFSGSTRYGEKDWKYMVEKWDREDFVACIAKRLPILLNRPHWRYLLCKQKPPVFGLDYKLFTLYRAPAPITKSQKVGSFVHLEPFDLLEGGHEVKCGFACTASILSTKKLPDGQPDTVDVTYMFKAKAPLPEGVAATSYKKHWV